MVNTYYIDISKHKINNFDFKGFCDERIKYVLSIKDENRRIQSYFAWKLLLKILPYSDYSFTLKPNGKWVEKNDKIFFSISHSKNVVSVTLSDKPCGVDVELVSEKIYKIKNRLSNLSESLSKDELTRKFTQFEASYKSNNAPINTYFNLADEQENKYELCCSAYGESKFIKFEL